MNTTDHHTAIPLADFIATNALTMAATDLPARTDGTPPTGRPGVRHWLVTLRHLPTKRSYSFQYSDTTLELPIVLDKCICSASAFEVVRDPKLPVLDGHILDGYTPSDEFAFETQFEAFCHAMGDSPNSRAAERRFHGCVRMWHGLKSILSDAAFAQAVDGKVEGL